MIKHISAIGTTNLNPKSKNNTSILFLIMLFPLIFKYQPEIKQRNRVLSGSIIFDVKKSKKSNIVRPKILTSPKIPNDNVAGIAISEIIKNSILQALILDILNLSINVAQGPSIILMPEVTAALKSNTKNAKETKFPYGTCENILGKVTKTSPAPEFGSRLNENTAGKIIIPARIAKAVSDKIIV